MLSFRPRAYFWPAIILLSACGGEPTVAPGERLVTLPNDRKIVAEVMMRPEDMARGMMYRESLAPDRGMLFFHTSPGRYPYWMHNCKIALDLIWLDAGQRVVEIVPNAPACEKPADQCPSYGGTQEARYVLELAGGLASKYGLAPGVKIDF